MKIFDVKFIYVGVWRSLVAHLVWDQGVGGSNPLAPTICSSAVNSHVEENSVTLIDLKRMRTVSGSSFFVIFLKRTDVSFRKILKIASERSERYPLGTDHL